MFLIQLGWVLIFYFFLKKSLLEMRFSNNSHQEYTYLKYFKEAM